MSSAEFVHSKVLRLIHHFTVLLEQTQRRSCVTWSLLSHLQAKIKFNGPITVAEYMKEVLTNPKSVCFLCTDFHIPPQDSGWILWFHVGRPSVFSFQDDNFCKYQCIFTKLGTCM